MACLCYLSQLLIGTQTHFLLLWGQRNHQSKVRSVCFMSLFSRLSPSESIASPLLPASRGWSPWGHLCITELLLTADHPDYISHFLLCLLSLLFLCYHPLVSLPWFFNEVEVQLDFYCCSFFTYKHYELMFLKLGCKKFSNILPMA